MATRLFWDFFGPRADGTAEHFLGHLKEFLAREKLEGCQLSMASAGEGHRAVVCQAPDELVEALTRALRPQRSEPA